MSGNTIVDSDGPGPVFRLFVNTNATDLLVDLDGGQLSNVADGAVHVDVGDEVTVEITAGSLLLHGLHATGAINNICYSLLFVPD